MSKLKKEHLNQMIETALSYKQELKPLKSNSFYIKFQGLILKPKMFGLTFASLIISGVFITPIVTSRNLVDVNELNDYVTFRVIEEF